MCLIRLQKAPKKSKAKSKTLRDQSPSAQAPRIVSRQPSVSVEDANALDMATNMKILRQQIMDDIKATQRQETFEVQEDEKRKESLSYHREVFRLLAIAASGLTPN